jgi:hypothetical protein
MTNLIPYIGIWAFLAFLALALALYRKFVSAHEEDRYVHISEGEAHLIPRQVSINRRLQTIDRWGELLTILSLIAGLVLAAVYLYYMIYVRG